MEAITDIDLHGDGVLSLFLRDLSEYVTLPFLAAFDVQETSTTTTRSARQKRVTYIALSKKAMPLLVESFLQSKEDLVIYNDGTLESMLSVRFSAPPKYFRMLMRLRHIPFR